MKDFIDYKFVSDETISQLVKVHPGVPVDDSVVMLLRQYKRVLSDANRVAEKFTSEQLSYLQACVGFEDLCSNADEHLSDQLVECIIMADPETDEGDILPPDWFEMVKQFQELSVGEQLALIHLLEKRVWLRKMDMGEDEKS